ncbi:prephenate dehydratase [Shimia sp. NS0008-38b]|uniref:prephenate dehydratase n=1 Tax=Shimia sp. NS0008-38b TaxID=3127653 RepID=UPI003341C604
MTNRIAFQGEAGAYSHEACQAARPNMEAMPCRTFEDVIAAVKSGEADLAMLPIENSTYGRVADIHRLLPESGLHIIDEAFVRVRISLLGLPGVPMQDIDTVRAHLVLLPQSAGFLKAHNMKAFSAVDSAGAARELSEKKPSNEGVLASELAADIYGLQVLARDVEDHGHNTTRFLIMSRDPDHTRRTDRKMITTFVFEVRNIPAALYKAMGGFATNGINMTKLESYMVGGNFTATRFYADIEGHPEDRAVRLAMDELRYFTTHVSIIGVYPAERDRMA